MGPRTVAKPAAADEPAVGKVIDGCYTLGREIARGGMGAIFEAEHPITGRTVAIKLALGLGAKREEAEARLLREARAINVVRHDGIVELLDARKCDRYGPYLVLEVLSGLSLDVVLERTGKLSVTDTVHIGRQLCAALAVAHERGVIHRDLKPSNTFLNRQGSHEVVKLLDFGVAQLTDEKPDEPKLTRVNQVLGTPEYMSPELISGEPVDQRADIYAVAVTMFECLTGQVPFTGNFRQIAIKVLTSAAPPPVRTHRKSVPVALEKVISRAMQLNVDERIPDAPSLLRELVDATGLVKGNSALLNALDDDGAARRGVRKMSPSRRAGAQPRRQQTTPPIPLVQRKYSRAAYSTPATLGLSDGTNVAGEVVDISEGGMRLHVQRPIDDEKLVFVRFVLPGGASEVTLQARSRWRGGEASGTLGVSFARITRPERELIAKHVERERAR